MVVDDPRPERASYDETSRTAVNPADLDHTPLHSRHSAAPRRRAQAVEQQRVADYEIEHAV